MALINENNLDEKTLTNAQVLAILNKVSRTMDGSGASRIMDAVEDLTGVRYFENSKVDKAENEVSLMLAKDSQLANA